MTRLALCLARLCASAWVGAAVLFVVVSVGQVLSRQFTSEVTDRLVALRFPPYYLFGFGLVGAALLGTLLGWRHVGSGRRAGVIGVLLVLALVLMAGDYLAIYRPLIAMITPPGQTRTADFERYHHASELANTVHLGLVTLAALLLNWPPASSDGASSHSRT